MLRVALCQLTSSADPAVNLGTVRTQVAEAAAEGARVVVFPEAMMAQFGTPLTPLAEPLDGPWASGVAAIAVEHDVLVVAGMFTPAAQQGPGGTRVRNTILATGFGQHLGYDKIHLYDAFGFRESDTVEGGSEPATAEVDGVLLGITACYDVRFPELFQELADRGTAAVVVPASWGAGPGKREQWELLVRARALDSGSWVLGCGQADPAETAADVHPKAPTGIGFSTVAEPFGEVHAQLGPAPGRLLADIDPELATTSRAATAVLPNRRLGRTRG
ncbi:carbon-nitrogen hydrolase family protein [Amycolatopsis palatopharyngis]|uniref:carbon-nitrogen hydrolase family protein n=1 Tax=Amycolatopsis palatopharyngis TaxID=187982 RepID=UPI000E27F672|nr:carbon-nitrogen hydrolase family protein [Amycolatopsis palatopharyngis]